MRIYQIYDKHLHIHIYIDVMSMKSDNLYMHTYIVCVLKLTVISHLL